MDIVYSPVVRACAWHAALYTTFTITVAWLYYLLEPAILASCSSKYAGFRWAKGNRRLWNFFPLAYESSFKAKSLFKTAYTKIRDSKGALLVPVPHCLAGFMVLLPKALIAEYARQPDSSISFHQFIREGMNAKYTLFGDNIIDNNVQNPIVHRELSQKLSDKMEMINEEMVAALKDTLHSQFSGGDEVKFNIWELSSKILLRTTNRNLVGLPLCRNPEYLDATTHYSTKAFATIFYVRLIPPFLRPVLAPLLCRPLKRDREIVAKHAVPIIQERMKIVMDAAEKGIEPSLPNDLLSATMKEAYKSSNQELEFNSMTLVNRILTFNLIQAYTNTMTLTNLIHDLISFQEDAFDEIVGELRAEINRELGKGDEWTSAFCDRLEIMDSFIRESLRVNPVGELGVERVVAKKNGFTFSNGFHLPQGTTVALPIRAMQRDPELYPGGFDYKRSLRDPARPKITTTSPDFLNFGLGRPACPGRFYAANVLKLAMSHLLLDFDLERVGERPAGVRKVTLVEPCGDSLITFKRRQLSE